MNQASLNDLMNSTAPERRQQPWLSGIRGSLIAVLVLVLLLLLVLVPTAAGILGTLTRAGWYPTP